VNKYDESPMFIAVMRNYKDVFEKLLEIPDSAHGGGEGPECSSCCGEKWKFR